MCWMCGSEDHVKTDCEALKDNPNLPHDEWFINKAMKTQRKLSQCQEQKQRDKDKAKEDNAMSAISEMTEKDNDVWGTRRPEMGSPAFNSVLM